MNIGLCGSQGTGKTTLAGEFARRNKQYTFLATPTSAIMARHGMDPARDYPIEDRIRMQGIILTELDLVWGSLKENAIFDRTPLDTAAYMLADVQRENVPGEHHDAIVEYVRRCFDIASRRFSLIVQIPPVLPLQLGREGKAPSTPAYVEHFHQLIAGLRNDERMKVRHVSLPRNYIDLELRCKALEGTSGRMLRNFMVEVETNMLNGVQPH